MPRQLDADGAHAMNPAKRESDQIGLDVAGKSLTRQGAACDPCHEVIAEAIP
jgi:hypothetical protein